MDKVFNVTVDTINTVKNSALIVNTNDLQTLKFLITINQKGTPVDLTGATVRIAVRKPDKKSVFQDCVITDAGAGKCEVLLLSQAYVVPGLHVVELMVYYAADIVAVTSRFSYTASKGLLDNESVQSTNEFQAITQTLNEVHATVEDLRLNGTGIDAQAREDLVEVNAQMAKITNKAVVNVEDFSGTNTLDKIQNAINYSVANGAILEFTKMYDITGYGSLSIIKDYPYTGVFYINGAGGGIIKNDTGYVFENPPTTPLMSDINIEGMRFICEEPTASVKVWNGDYFIRVNSSNNFYKGIDNVLLAGNIRAQSWRFDKEVIRGGNSYAFLSKIFIEVTIKDCLIEERTSGWGYSGGGIANTVSSSNITDKVNNYSLRIENNVIEGLALEGVKLGTCVASKITGNYMEENGGYYDLWTLVDDGSYSNALDFSANHTQMTNDQVTAQVPTLKIKNILRNNSAQAKQKANTVFSNNRTNGVLYETNSFINSVGDYSTVNKLCVPQNKLILMSGTNYMEEDQAVGNLPTIVSGVSYGFRKIFNFSLTASEEKTLVIQVTNAYFSNPITTNSVVSVTVNNLIVTILAYNWEYVSTNKCNVRVKVKNTDSVNSISSTINVNVINLGD